MKVYSIQTSLAFGHELDDQWAEAKRKWNNAYNRAAYYIKYVENENADFKIKDNNLDTKIQQAKNEEHKSLNVIKEKQFVIEDLKNRIEDKQQKADKILEEINLNSQQIQEANNKHNLSLESFILLKNETTNNHVAKLTEVQFNHQNEYANIANGIKAQLIKKLINPINTRFDDNSQTVASNVFISDVLPDNHADTESLYEKILFWVVNLTNSNYGIVDASDYKDKPFDMFLQNLKTILFASNKLHELDGGYSITLISNLQSIMERFSPKEDNIFVEIVQKSSELFHNSFIIIAKQNEKMEKLFSSKLKLDKFFINDSRFGIKSFIPMIENKKTLGKNLQQFLK